MHVERALHTSSLHIYVGTYIINYSCFVKYSTPDHRLNLEPPAFFASFATVQSDLASLNTKPASYLQLYSSKFLLCW